MLRRPLLATISCFALGGRAAAAPRDDELVRASGHTVSLPQLQVSLAERFPLRYQVGGMFDLTLRTPSLRLLPQHNRLGAHLTAVAAGPMMGNSHAGGMDLDFALHYETTDRTIRANQPRVRSLRISGLPVEAIALLDNYGPALVEQMLQKAVLHRLRPEDLALADSLGLQPDRITVTADGLHIGLANKPR